MPDSTEVNFCVHVSNTVFKFTKMALLITQEKKKPKANAIPHKIVKCCLSFYLINKKIQTFMQFWWCWFLPQEQQFENTL